VSYAIRDDGDFELCGSGLVPLSAADAADTAARVALFARAPYGSALSPIVVGSSDEVSMIALDMAEAVEGAFNQTRDAQLRDGCAVVLGGIRQFQTTLNRDDRTRLDFNITVWMESHQNET
jgi:hypothetical protein